MAASPCHPPLLLPCWSGTGQGMRPNILTADLVVRRRSDSRLPPSLFPACNSPGLQFPDTFRRSFLVAQSPGPSPLLAICLELRPLPPPQYPAQSVLRTLATHGARALSLTASGLSSRSRTGASRVRALPVYLLVRHYPVVSGRLTLRSSHLIRVSLPRFHVPDRPALVLFEVCSAYAVGTAITGRPPAQSGYSHRPTKASGSYLRCLTSNRSSGQGE